MNCSSRRCDLQIYYSRHYLNCKCTHNECKPDLNNTNMNIKKKVEAI